MEQALATQRRERGGGGALGLQEVCREMETPLVRRREEDEYENRLSTLLVEVRHRPNVPLVVAIDILALPMNLGR